MSLPYEAALWDRHEQLLGVLPGRLHRLVELGADRDHGVEDDHSVT
jgi:hypothetical protein